MYRFFWLILCSAVLLIAADPVWVSKPIANWTEDDARQVLASSPWAKSAIAGVTRRETEDERREGGAMGQPTGVGFDGVDDKFQNRKNLQSIASNPFAVDKTAAPKRPVIRLTVRWESALPIRAAEFKAHEAQPPTLSDDGYSIAVYGIPASFAKGDPTSLGKPLKEYAFLKREGKIDVKPSSAEVFQLEDSIVVVYRFPLSAEIGKKDSIVEFSALIGRLRVTEDFLVEEMTFQGKLEL
jgi:hypothetical protein